MGNRFVAAGYNDPKPLIKVDGISIIEHVVNLFPGETNISFICNTKHLGETHMFSELKRIAPQSEVYEIPPHQLGPVYAVMQIADTINDDEEVIVNYCDFGTYWDYDDFLHHTRTRKADGAIVSYKNFHPHMLGSTNYAFMRDEDQWLLEIKEKEPFTNDRTQEYASNGTYYFRTGAILKKYFQALLDSEVDLNGEYYVSMVYNHLVNDGLKVSVYNIQHMLQWGTPQDLEAYQEWSNYFAKLMSPQPKPTSGRQGRMVVPMAGHGSRFVKEGYTTPKPLIEVSGKPMVLQAAAALPDASEQIFCCLGTHLDAYPLEAALNNTFPNCNVVRVEEVTEGQACTIELGLDGADEELPLVVGACDNSMVYDRKRFDEIVSNEKISAVAFSFRNHPSTKRNPQMYGWFRVKDGDRVTGVSVKEPISDTPENDHAVVGSFYFCKTRYFYDAIRELYKRNNRVKGEFYADSLIGILAEMGHDVRVFEVDHYICWGTPDDLRTYEYWQSFFHKAPWHAYNIAKDPLMASTKVDEYVKRSEEFHQMNK